MAVKYSRVSVVTSCFIGYTTGQKKASFHFYEDQEFERKCIFLCE